MNIAKRILELRSKYNISQGELSKMVGVTRQTISSWENGKSVPDINQSVKLAKAFKITLDELIKEEEK